MTIHVLYGPQMTGKTLISEKLKSALGAKRIVEDYCGTRHDPAIHDGDLVITNLEPDELKRLRTHPAGVNFIPVKVAHAMVGKGKS